VTAETVAKTAEPVLDLKKPRSRRAS